MALDSKIIYFLFPTYGQWVVALKISHLCFTGDVVGSNMVTSSLDKAIYSSLDYVGVLINRAGTHRIIQI